MSCSCGSASARNGSAIIRSDSVVCELRFGVCSSCGGVGSEVLLLDGDRVADGVEARRRFQNAKAGTLPGRNLEFSQPDHVSRLPEDDDSLSGRFDMEAAARASEYHPYKLFFIDGREPIYTVCIKSPSPAHFAACPALEVFISDDDYLTATFRMVRAITDVLGVGQAAKVATTCTAPFPLKPAEKGQLAPVRAETVESKVPTPGFEEPSSASRENPSDDGGQLELAL